MKVEGKDKKAQKLKGAWCSSREMKRSGRGLQSNKKERVQESVKGKVVSSLMSKNE